MKFYQCNKSSFRKQHLPPPNALPLLLTLALFLSLIPHSSIYAQEGGSIYLPFINTGGNTAPERPSNNDIISIETIEDQNFLIAGNGSGYVGAPLYYYLEDNEEASESSCDAACTEAWPPLTVTSAEQLFALTDNSEQFSTIQRENGSRQITYSGWPLYRYAGDNVTTAIDSDLVIATTITPNGRGLMVCGGVQR